MAIPAAEKRIIDFEELGFGMFIHFGLYSQLGRGEWVQHIEKIPKEEYMKLADTFTAKDFDARKIASMASAAGVKYITLTTRHHEGFSLYDTKGLNTYDSLHSPCGRDLVREFTDACREFGIKPFLYHTTADWYNPDFREDFKKYLQYLRDSV
jgi:alpha-L-fucosidase